MQQHIFLFVSELDELQPKSRFSEFALRAEIGAPIDSKHLFGVGPAIERFGGCALRSSNL
jgi:hypothetical protein